jgi:non-specific serine/threonine protein kinase
MIGTNLSHYHVTGKLGVGGMGVVYEAVDTRLGRPVALKFLSEELAGDPDASRRLRREAQTIAGLNHPNICTVYEFDEHEGSTFIAMERVEGRNLKVHMAQRQLPTAEVVNISMQIASALEAAHAAGIVHRDVKPGNIIVGPNGVVKVLDFGLARRFMLPGSDEPVIGGSTIPGRPIGSVNYMAPERILQLPLDPRSDLFSLGVVVYEMATGRLPFGGASPSDTVTNILESDPIPLMQLASTRPASLDRVVNRLLAKSAERRYQTAGDLRTALASLKPSRSWWQRLRRR